jgi:uracil-DNA glycosylase family 4
MMLAFDEKEDRFADLVRRVSACRKCPRMAQSARVFGAGCGSLSAKLMFIGEAPGRLGADASELPFHGDKSGHNFEELLEQVGLSRYDAFVTNAVLCNPRDESGNNATPTPTEVANCAPYLREQLDLVAAPIVVTLGAVALRATALVEPHSLTLSSGVRKAFDWGGRRLMPAYHPGQRAMVHRSFANQLADYQFIAEAVRRGKRAANKATYKTVTRTSQKVGAAAQVLLETSGELSYFALHKLMFLSEVKHLESWGERITDGYFVRQKDGPYCVELHASRLSALVPGAHGRQLRGTLLVYLGQRSLLADCTGQTDILSDEERTTLRAVALKYGQLSAAKLKTATYLTSPMRELLRREKSLKINLFNSAVLPRKLGGAAGAP